MIGQSKAFLEMMRLIGRAAHFDAPVLIQGETGTGKELAARAIHLQSARQDKPFVPINCGALPDLLLENELFGHHRGAFTDARDDRLGLVGHAHSGTLFLDEVETLTPKGQVTLLRFLQDLNYRPLGSYREQTADVRVISATNADLQKLADQGSFRHDLLYRLKVLFFVPPPLRERKGDTALLADHFVANCSKRYGQPPKRIHPETLEWFDCYAWPGNIRELENLVCREFLLNDGPLIHLDPLSEPRRERRIQPDRRRPTFDEAGFVQAKAKIIEEFEARYLANLLRKTNGNVTSAAVIAGTERRYIGKLIKKHGLDKEQFRH